MKLVTVEMSCGTTVFTGLNRMSGNVCPKTGLLLGPTSNVQLLAGLAKKLPWTVLVAAV